MNAREENTSRKNGIIFYDGDGGGFCAHLRHLFELYFIGKLTGKYIYDNYPLTHRFFSHASDYKNILESNQYILMSELVDSTENFSSLCAKIKDTNGIILAGKHHYSRHFQKYLKECIGGSNVYRCQKNFFKKLEYVSEKKKQKYDIGIHIRTLIDSPDGYEKYKRQRESIFKWVLKKVYHFTECYNDNPKVFFASDNNDETNMYVKTLESQGIKVSKGEVFSHTSLTKYLGRDLLVKTHDINYQLKVAIEQAEFIKQGRYIDMKGTNDLLELARSAYIIGTASTYNQAAYVLGDAKRISTYGYDRYSKNDELVG